MNISKTEKINELKNQQLKLIKESIKISKLPPAKKSSTRFKRTALVVVLAIQYKMIQEQINHIRSQK